MAKRTKKVDLGDPAESVAASSTAKLFQPAEPPPEYLGGNAGRPRVRPEIAPANPVGRALSAMRPYAWGIVAGYKMVENRAYGTQHRGWIAIHSSSSNMGDAGAEQDYDYISQSDPAVGWEFFDGEHIKEITPRNPMLEKSCIVGVAELVGIVDATNHHGESEAALTRLVKAAGFGDWIKRQRSSWHLWANPGMHWWLLDNPIQFAKPIKSIGATKLWRVPPRTAASIAKAAQSGPYGLPMSQRKTRRKKK